MRKWLVSIMIAAGIVSCGSMFNDNELSVTNSALDDVFLHFRGEQYRISPDATRTISDIPNGTFLFSTTWVLPANAASGTADEGLSGTMLFQRGNTKIGMRYAGIMEEDAYKISATFTSSDPLETSVKRSSSQEE